MPRRIAVTGGTGFIGRHLVDALLTQGDQVLIVSRSMPKIVQPGAEIITWAQLESGDSRLEGLDAIVNLAGESINQRWTPSAKARILDSRMKTTDSIARLVERLERKPRVVINGSGMSIYGTSETVHYDESSPVRLTDFLAGVVEQWEHAAQRISGTRLVLLRIGIVLGADGGALPPMLLPYRLFAGGRVGSGRQWMSWIHIEDIIRLTDFCIECEEIEGPVNATAPHPVRNNEFGRMIAKTTGRPHWFPVPSFLFKLLFGELSVLLLEGQHVLPRKPLELGFEFRYPTLETALRQLLSRS